MNTDMAGREIALDLLCFRALRLSGETFPLTKEEIRAFEASIATTAEEQARLEALVAHAISEASGNQGFNGTMPRLSLFEKLQAQRESASLGYAARKAKDKGLSPDLEEELNRLMDEASGMAAEDESEYGDVDTARD